MEPLPGMSLTTLTKVPVSSLSPTYGVSHLVTTVNKVADMRWRWMYIVNILKMRNSSTKLPWFWANDFFKVEKLISDEHSTAKHCVEGFKAAGLGETQQHLGINKFYWYYCTLQWRGEERRGKERRGEERRGEERGERREERGGFFLLCFVLDTC